MTTEPIVGFDAKLIDPKLSLQAWPKSRRDAYLMRPDAPHILSVDTSVTPSLFKLEGAADFTWHRMGLGVWASLDELRNAIGSAVTEPSCEPTCIAITAPDPVTFTGDTRWIEAAKEPTNPAAIDPAWAFLGYDVADAHFLSGLSNCGLNPEEYASLRPIHAPHINDFGLFGTADAALAFRRVIDTLAREHAPFFPFGIWSI